MARKLNKREQEVLDYLDKNKNDFNKLYVSAKNRNDPAVDWFLGHAAEAIIIDQHVRDILGGN